MLRAGDEASANGMTCFLLGNPMTSAQRCRFPAILGEGKSRPACREPESSEASASPTCTELGAISPGYHIPRWQMVTTLS